MKQDQNILATLLSIPFSRGALAGLVATVPMTLFMLVMHRLLPNWQRYALPPERVTGELAERADVDLDKPQLLGASLLSHFGYGANMGALYSSLTRRIPLPPVLKGIVFGIAIWAASYLGWMPGLRIEQAATEEPLRRNVMMVAAHMIWGATTGIVADRLGR